MKMIYTLVGIYDQFKYTHRDKKIDPGFVYPVFKGEDDNYYIGFVEDTVPYYRTFIPICEEEMFGYESFDDASNVNITVPLKPYYVGKEAITCFLKADGSIYIYSLEDMLKFVQTYETDNQRIKEEIKEFKSDAKIYIRAKNNKKS